ncbi:MAG: RDD family protein [Exilibacterium sp.]
MNNPNDYPAARPLRRLAALFYDSLLVAAISIVYGAAAVALRVLLLAGTAIEEIEAGSPAVGGIWFQCGWLVTIVIFFSYFWHRGGQTLGMKAWRLRLTSADPSLANPAWSQCLLRCLVGPISLLCAGIGYLWCYIDKNGRSLHDRLTKTQVIVLPKSS